MTASQLTRRIAIVGTSINATGAVIAFSYLAFVAPPSDPAYRDRLWILAVVSAIYVAIGSVTAVREGRRIGRDLYAWLDSGRPRPREQQRAVLVLPKHLTLISIRRWATRGAAVHARRAALRRRRTR